MSRATSELASAFLLNLSKSTAEPQTSSVGWENVLRVKRELKGAASTGFDTLSFHNSVLLHRK